MMTRESDKKREQVMFFSMDELVPKDHLLRLIEQSIDFSMNYERKADQIFDGSKRLFAGRRIDLGISSDGMLQVLSHKMDVTLPLRPTGSSGATTRRIG